MNERMSILCCMRPTRVRPRGPSAHPSGVPPPKGQRRFPSCVRLETKGEEEKACSWGITKNLAEGARVFGDGVLAGGGPG